MMTASPPDRSANPPPAANLEHLCPATAPKVAKMHGKKAQTGDLR